jgi:adenylosuccinate synthase
MKRRAVIGLGFGDEGKGVVTDYLCSQNPDSTTVMRFSGGHQCAHTVVVDGIEHVFANFGSGTLRGCPTYWSEYCTFEPTGFIKEYNILKEKGINPCIYIHDNCKVTTPEDIVANWKEANNNHGTTGTGFWKTIERNQAGITLSISDILNNRHGKKRSNVMEYYKHIVGNDASITLGIDFHGSLTKLERILNESVFLSNVYPTDKDIVFEGNQGLLLDKDIGFFPHVTPSKTNLNNIFKLGYELDEVYLVTRAYQTRHGNGPMSNEDKTLNIIEVHEKATKENQFQGKLRKTILDLDLLKKGVDEGINETCERREITKNLVVTCLDQIKGKPTLTHNKKLIEFDTIKNFIKYIGKALGIDGKLHGNWSKYSNTIQVI